MAKVKIVNQQEIKAVMREIIREGTTVGVPTFYHVGVAYMLLKFLAESRTRGLRIIRNDPGLPGLGTGLLIRNNQVESLVVSYIATNPEAMDKYMRGELNIEMYPQGTLIRKLQAGAEGGPEKNIGGVLTRTGIGTEVAEGKRIFNIDGLDYIYEPPLRAQVGLIKTWIADKKGNLIYNRAARNFNPVVAGACDITIVEADIIVDDLNKLLREKPEIVPYLDWKNANGAYLNPNIIHTPFCYVDYIVQSDGSWRRDLRVNQPKSQIKLDPKRLRIVKRAAREIQDGDIVNLGIGTPLKIADLIPKDIAVDLQSENGILGMGPAPKAGFEDNEIINAGRIPATLKPGGAFFDSLESFKMITGGKVDKTFLGAFQVDEEGNLANYKIPGKRAPGIGGGMDLVTGAKKVIIVTEHLSGDGQPRIVDKCTLPLTGKKVVDLVITDLAVIEVAPEGLILKEIASDTTIEEVIAKTRAKLIIAGNVSLMK